MILFVPLMMLMLLGAMILQEFMQPVFWSTSFGDLQIFFLIPWVVFYSQALALPYPLMLLFALFTGFFWDARVPVALDAEEFRMGGSVVLFALFGSVMQGVRPLFRKGSWLLPIFMVGMAILVHLFTEMLLVSFTRGAFLFTGELWIRMVCTAGASLVMSPFILLVISRTARRCGYKLEFEQMMFRRSSSPYGYQI